MGWDGAVKEMQRLMEGRVSGLVTQQRKDRHNEKDRGGKQKRQQKLPWEPPPIRGHALDLQPILDTMDERKVLEGPEVLDIVLMLELWLDMLDWRDALLEANDKIHEEPPAGGNNDSGDLDLQQEPFAELSQLASLVSLTSSRIVYVYVP